MDVSITRYSPKEEFLNILSHFIGLILSIGGLATLITFASIYGTVWHIISFSIFGSSLVTLYLASTLYHASKKKELRSILNVLDHAAIYVLIAGTYTPFCLVTLNGMLGWILFGVIWGLAFIGIVLKIFFTGKYDKVSTIGYVAMGWVAVLAARPLIEQLDWGSLTFLLIGGICYTVGAVFYLLERIPFNHAIFHCWVLLGSLTHFVSIFLLLE